MIKIHESTIIFEHKKSFISEKTNFLTHMHNYWEIYLLLDGTTNFNLNGIDLQLNKNSLLIISPSTYHSSKPNNNYNYERLVINFYENDIGSTYLENFKKSPIYYDIDKNIKIKNLFNFLINDLANYTKHDIIMTLKNSIRILLTMLKYSNNEIISYNYKNETNNSLVNKIINYINENIKNNLTIESIAKKFFISTSTLSHTFKNQLNITVKQYINYKKILFAQHKILSGNSIKEVFINTNIKDYSTFYRLYKNYLKTSPSQDGKEFKKQK